MKCITTPITHVFDDCVGCLLEWRWKLRLWRHNSTFPPTWYNYHPLWSVTRRFVSQRKVRSPSGHTPTRVIIGILYRIFLHQTPSNRKPSGHTPTRVIIGILYRIFLHQTPSNRIPAAFRKYSIEYIAFLLRLQRRTCRWTPCLLSVESREVTIIGNTWALRLAVDPTNG
jgi:hypothetical protein